MNARPAVILSGGSEIVSLGIAEALAAHGVPLAVLSLGRNSLLRDLPQTIHHEVLPWPPESEESGVASLLDAASRLPLGGGIRSPVFATEDGGLRLLYQARDELTDRLIVPGAARLQMGGLDKAEFFDAMQSAGLDNLLAPTLVMRSISDAAAAFDRFGPDVVFKPSMKSFTVVLPGAHPKVITAEHGESPESVAARLSAAWPASPQSWVAQQRLTGIDQGDVNWYGARLRGEMMAMETREFWKSPRIGGSGCWVADEHIPELHDIAVRIVGALELEGVAELSFLRDLDGKYRLFEFNPRCWLQIALPEIVGIPMVYASYASMTGSPLPKPAGRRSGASWVNPERVLAAALSGDYGNRGRALVKGLGIIARADYRTVYSTSLPGIRRRWIARMVSKAVSRS